MAALCRATTAALRLPAAAIAVPHADGWRVVEQAGLEDGLLGSVPDFVTSLGASEPAIIPDARRDTRLATHPAVAGEAGIRSVALVPLRSPAGEVVGCLCALGRRSRRATAAWRARLQDLAGIAASLLGQHLLTTRLEREISERHESEQALRVVGARLRAAVDSLPFQFWMVDGRGRCIMQNREDERAWGKIVGRPIHDPLADMEQNQEWQRRLAAAFAGETVTFEMRYEREDGPVDFEEIIAPVTLDGELIGLVGLGIDVTARRRAEAALAEAQRRLEALTEADIVGVVFGEEDRITACNREFTRILGGPDAAAAGLASASFDDLAPGVSAARLKADLLANGRLGPFESELAGPDGRAVPVLMAAALVERVPMRWLGLIQDISEQKQAEARIRELADTDALTRLANRRSFMAALERRLADLRPGDLGAVLLLDLDRFKETNDTLGHDAGDALLQAVARRLESQSRAVDTVARLGGDEFAVVLGKIGSTDDVRAFGERLLAALAAPVRHGACELHVRASIGASLFPPDGESASVLLKNADIALYRGKSQGRGSLTFFDPALRVGLEEKRRLAENLRHAVAQDRIELVYQPQVGLRDGAHQGFEALARWRRDGALLPPGAFLPVAEETGQSLAIGRAVMRKALAQMRAWLDEGLEPGRIAINVAASQLKIGDFAGELAEMLRSQRLPPQRVEIEITENVLLECGQDRVTAVLRAVSRQGVSIALDDFGTGYASLAHLRHLPVNRLKIDRSFVSELRPGMGSTAIVLNILSLAQALGLEVVAEGIETVAQRDFLADAGCEVGQGFLFARGLGGEAAGRRLHRETAPTLTGAAVAPFRICPTSRHPRSHP